MCGSATASRTSRAPMRFASRPTRAASPRASLVLATGGLSIPKMGATGFAYDIAKRFGLRITETLPGLVPLTASPAALGIDDMLSGISLDAIASCGHAQFPREHPVHASRAVRPGDPADLVLLAAGRDNRARPAAGARRRSAAERAQARASESRTEDGPGRIVSRAPRAGARRRLAAGDDGQCPRPHARGLCGAAEALGGHADRLGRLRQGRGDRRRDRYARPVLEDHGGAGRCPASTPSARRST